MALKVSVSVSVLVFESCVNCGDYGKVRSYCNKFNQATRRRPIEFELDY